MTNRVSIAAAVFAFAFSALSFCDVSSSLRAGESAAAVKPFRVGDEARLPLHGGLEAAWATIAKAKEPDYDDSAWRMLDLPHDWSVEGKFDMKLASCTAFLPCGTGWYRKAFTVAADAKEKLVSIRFEGVMNHATVWCNGKQVGERPYGYSSFTCDLLRQSVSARRTSSRFA